MRLSVALALAFVFSPVMGQASSFEATSFTWTGAFVGINAGYGRGSSDWDFTGGGSNSHTIDGGLIGLQVGYNAQLASGLVAGIELSTEATNVGGKSGCSGSTCKNSVDSLTDISGRLGVNRGGSLLFGKAGVAYENMHHSITGNDDKGGALGYVVGAGMEFLIDTRLSTKIEYDYYHFGSNSATLGTTHIDDSNTVSVLKAGFNLHFD